MESHFLLSCSSPFPVGFVFVVLFLLFLFQHPPLALYVAHADSPLAFPLPLRLSLSLPHLPPLTMLFFVLVVVFVLLHACVGACCAVDDR